MGSSPPLPVAASPSLTLVSLLSQLHTQENFLRQVKYKRPKDYKDPFGGTLDPDSSPPDPTPVCSTENTPTGERVLTGGCAQDGTVRPTRLGPSIILQAMLFITFIQISCSVCSCKMTVVTLFLLFPSHPQRTTRMTNMAKISLTKTKTKE